MLVLVQPAFSLSADHCKVIATGSAGETTQDMLCGMAFDRRSGEGLHEIKETKEPDS